MGGWQALVVGKQSVWGRGHLASLRKICADGGAGQQSLLLDESAVEGFGGTTLSVDSAVKYLQMATNFFKKAHLFQFSAELLELMIHVYKARHAYAQVGGVDWGGGGWVRGCLTFVFGGVCSLPSATRRSPVCTRRFWSRTPAPSPSRTPPTTGWGSTGHASATSTAGQDAREMDTWRWVPASPADMRVWTAVGAGSSYTGS